MLFGGVALDIADLIGQSEIFPRNPAFARPAFDGFPRWFPPPRQSSPMELFTRLFGDLLTLVYHCFDRIVIHGYLSGLSRPEQVVYFFREVLGIRS